LLAKEFFRSAIADLAPGVLESLASVPFKIFEPIYRQGTAAERDLLRWVDSFQPELIPLRQALEEWADPGT